VNINFNLTLIYSSS